MEMGDPVPATQAASDVLAWVHAQNECRWNRPLCDELSPAPTADSRVTGVLDSDIAELPLLESFLPFGSASSSLLAREGLDTAIEGATPPRRRRLSSKQSCSEIEVQQQLSLAPALDADSPDREPDNSACPDNSRADKSFLFSAEHRGHYKMFHKSFTAWLRSRCSRGGPSKRTSDCWNAFLLKHPEEQARLVQLWRKISKCSDRTVQWALDSITDGRLLPKGVGRVEPASRNVVNTKCLMLTYQGDFGVWPSELATGTHQQAATESIRASNGLAKDLVQENKAVLRYVDHVTCAVRDSPRLQVLRQELAAFVQDINERHGIDTSGWALELCVKTLLEDATVRVHAHVFLNKSAGKIYTRQRDNFRFQGCAPHTSSSALARKRTNSAAAGLFYISAKGKYGLVAADSTLEPHRDYIVQPQWVLNMLGMGKMAPSAAREHLVRQARDLPRLLSSMDAYVEEIRRISLDRHISSVVEQLQLLQRPFHVLPIVQKWVEDHQALRWRYKFLVLHGPSMMGKTRYALSLAPAGRSLELNCVSGNEPDLRGYDPMGIDLILLDEMPAKGVLQQKKLMQCPPALLHLGTSATNAFAYKVWLHQKLVIVSTNNWFMELAEMPSGDRDWLESNAVVVSVTEPLWVDSCTQMV